MKDCGNCKAGMASAVTVNVPALSPLSVADTEPPPLTWSLPAAR